LVFVRTVLIEGEIFVLTLPIDRDSGKFHLDPVETERRRHLFMEIYVYDSWMALTLGRPPSIASAHYDIKPEPAGADEDKDDPSTACKFSSFICEVEWRSGLTRIQINGGNTRSHPIV
jgi:hypothetical protein